MFVLRDCIVLRSGVQCVLYIRVCVFSAHWICLAVC